MCDLAIEIRHLVKIYKMYNKPTDRILEAFHLGNKERYKEFRALNDVSFEVKKGETVGIIGTNGAGKSTLLKIITGVKLYFGRSNNQRKSFCFVGTWSRFQ